MLGSVDERTLLFCLFSLFLFHGVHIEFFIIKKNVVFKKLVRAHQQSSTITNTRTISIAKMNAFVVLKRLCICQHTCSYTLTLAYFSSNLVALHLSWQNEFCQFVWGFYECASACEQRSHTQ